jgi:beta-galactosidase
VLLEDQGRVNYGPRIGEPKGIIGGASVHGIPITGWDVLPIELETPPTPSTDPTGDVDCPGEPLAGPVLVRAGFRLDHATDLHLDTGGWGKGMAWLNGFHLGRYWRRGPQRTLYIPGPVVHAGANELVVFETHVMTDPAARFVAGPHLGHTEP